MRNIYRFLDSFGDGTGTKNANVDGSTVPQVFRITPESGDKTWLSRMIVHIEDTSGFNADNYGDLAAPLTNGILVQVRKQYDDSVVLDLCDGVPVKSNHDWSRMCYDVTLGEFGVGNESLSVRWTFAKSGHPLEITDDEYFCIAVQDDVRGLIEHYFMVQGWIE